MEMIIRYRTNTGTKVFTVEDVPMNLTQAVAAYEKALAKRPEFVELIGVEIVNA